LSYPSVALSGPSNVRHGAEEAATLTELEQLVRSGLDPVVRGFLLMADDSIVAVLPYALVGRSA